MKTQRHRGRLMLLSVALFSVYLGTLTALFCLLFFAVAVKSLFNGQSGMSA